VSIEFIVTTKHHLLEQYYALRERCFRQELGLPQFNGAEEESDRKGNILVAIKDGQVISGVRISGHISFPSQIESLELNSETSCMWERLVIAPSCRDAKFVSNFATQIAVTARNLGYQHAMVLSSLCNARFYRRCLSTMGFGYEIHRHVPHCAEGSFAGLEHYLSVAYLQNEQPMRLAV
jgi:hypothetical protein